MIHRSLAAYFNVVHRAVYDMKGDGAQAILIVAQTVAE